MSGVGEVSGANRYLSGAKLLEEAFSAKEKAYAPYSRFRVGAALLAASGKIYRGCNVENASFGLSVCAERVALFKAVSEGERDFAALGVAGDGEEYCVPCGACLQVLAEFNPQLILFLANRRGESVEKRLDELLTAVFSLDRQKVSSNAGGSR
ncbi:MAG: cytidine deaminase [Desulfotomaculales bacterium]